MTRLELAICEAENNGEIDIYTRDTMLSMINESTASARYGEKLKKQIEDKEKTIYKLKQIMKSSSLEDDDKKRYRVKKDAEARIDKLSKECDELYKKLYKFRAELDAKELGNTAAYYIGRTKKYPETEMIDKDNARRATEFGKSNVSRMRKRVKEKEVKPGRYKTTNGLKESVLEEIYEAELNGDITPEERMSLIDYMSY